MTISLQFSEKGRDSPTLIADEQMHTKPKKRSKQGITSTLPEPT